jgi:hypothetical protein
VFILGCYNSETRDRWGKEGADEFFSRRWQMERNVLGPPYLCLVGERKAAVLINDRRRTGPRLNFC